MARTRTRKKKESLLPDAAARFFEAASEARKGILLSSDPGGASEGLLDELGPLLRKAKYRVLAPKGADAYDELLAAACENRPLLVRLYSASANSALEQLRVWGDSRSADRALVDRVIADALPVYAHFRHVHHFGRHFLERIGGTSVDQRGIGMFLGRSTALVRQDFLVFDMSGIRRGGDPMGRFRATGSVPFWWERRDVDLFKAPDEQTEPLSGPHIELVGGYQREHFTSLVKPLLGCLDAGFSLQESLANASEFARPSPLTHDLQLVFMHLRLGYAWDSCYPRIEALAHDPAVRKMLQLFNELREFPEAIRPILASWQS